MAPKRTSATDDDFTPDEVAPAGPVPGATIRMKELVELVTTATGGKKSDVRRTVEATLAALGSALAVKAALNVPPLGKLRVAKSADGVLTLKLRLADQARAVGLALADDDEDG